MSSHYAGKNSINRAMDRIGSNQIFDCSYSATVISFDGLIVNSSNLPCSVGAICAIEHKNGHAITGEVVRISEDIVSIIPYDDSFPVAVGQKVKLLETSQCVGVGEELLGRAIDGLGKPLDSGLPIQYSSKVKLDGDQQNPLRKSPVEEVFDVGIRNINTLLTVGKGQRLGIMAGSGVGKSVLLSMISRNSSADVVVIALIGERGREVASFSHEILQSHSRDKVIIVAVPADYSPLLRIQGAKRATAIAEYFRDQGKSVLLIMDSLTRVAHAQRELGLALGEQPTARGYPPSVLSLLPKLIERTGTGLINQGAITSIYTVLADGDDVTSDPIVDTARAILDGHIVLERSLAQQGLYPAIDVSKSISRLMNSLVDKQQLKISKRLRMLISKYFENRDLFLMGGYVAGQDKELDAAIRGWPLIERFLMQDPDEAVSYRDSVHHLNDLMANL